MRRFYPNHPAVRLTSRRETQIAGDELVCKVFRSLRWKLLLLLHWMSVLYLTEPSDSDSPQLYETTFIVYNYDSLVSFIYYSYLKDKFTQM